MNVFIELVDASTGEIYYNKSINYAFNFGLPGDVGFKKIDEIVKSACRGARLKRTPLQLRLMFSEPLDTIELPFNDVNEFKTPYEVKPF